MEAFLMYWPCASPTRCQWIGYRASVMCWPMRFSSTPETNILLDGIHDVPAQVGLFCISRGLDLDVAGEQTNLTAFIHAEGDLAEVHVVELAVERDLVAADGGDRAPFGLARIEVRRRENDLVTDAPTCSVQYFDRRAAGFCGVAELGPSVGPIAVQVQCAARDHDPAVTHAGHDVFVGDGVGEGDRRVARVRARFAADRELAVQHDPLGGQLEVGVVRERELAVDRETAERGRADVEDHVLVAADRDLVAGDWHLAVRPGRRIGPVRRSGLCDRAYAAEQQCRNDRHAKERATLIGHDINPQNLKMTQCFEEEHSAIAPRSTAFRPPQKNALSYCGWEF